MRLPLLATLIPLLAGCQMLGLSGDDGTSPPPGVRWQGQLLQQQGNLYLSPCREQRRLQLVDADGLQDDIRRLSPDAAPLFIDLRARAEAGPSSGDGRLSFAQLYRLEREGRGCSDPGFARLLLRASGHHPDWSVDISEQGLLLQRPGQPPQALPYLEERLPGDQASFSSEADGQRLELWVAPQACQDIASGTRTPYSASLTLDGQTLRGCAYPGGAR